MSTPEPANTRSAIGSTIAQVQAERRWFTLMRLSFGGVCLSWLLLLGWVVPGGPIVEMVPDYSAAAVLGLILAIAAFCSSLAFFFVWRPAFSGESFRQFVSVLGGGGLLIRRRGQFEQRLQMACRRTAKHGDTFSLIVIQRPKDEAANTRRSFQKDLAALYVRGIARTDDIVGDAPPRELWVLATGAGDAVRDRIIQRIARAVQGAPQLDGASIGAATYGPGRAGVDELFSAARASLVPAAELARDAAA
jgi:hypothetical protein